MANNFLTPKIIAREALYALQRTRVFTGLVNNQYSNEFRNVGETISVRIPAVLAGRGFVDQVERQEINENFIPVKLDKIADVSVEIGSKELTLGIADFSVQVIEPMARALNNKIDKDISAFLYNMTLKEVTNTNDGTLKPIALLGNNFDRISTPTDNRTIVFSPDHKYQFALDENLSKVSYAGTSDTLRDGLLGRIYGMDTLMSNNLPISFADTVGTATAYLVEAVGTERAVKLTGVVPATGTVKAGDGFILNNVIYRFAEDATAVAGVIAKVALSIDSDRARNTTPEAVAIIPQNASLAFHRDVITFATAPLEVPINRGNDSYTAQGEGFAVRVVYGYDSDTKKNLLSMDVLYGINGLRDTLSAKLVD